MVKIADLFYTYNQTQQATTNGQATLQALAYTSLSLSSRRQLWYQDSTKWVETCVHR